MRQYFSHKKTQFAVFTSSILFFFVIVVPLMQISTPTYADTSYHVVFSKEQTFPFFDFTPGNLDDPKNAIFTIKNATRLWYSYTVKYSSNKITLSPAYPKDDPRSVIASRMDKVGLLFPPDTVYPFDVSENKITYAERLYAASFSAPNQRVTITATPFTKYAITLTAVGAIATAFVSVGNIIQNISTGDDLLGFLIGVSQIQHFSSFVADFQTLVINVQKGRATINDAKKCIIDLYDLFNDTKDIKFLESLLTKAIGATATTVISKLSGMFENLNKLGALAGTLFDYANVYLNEKGNTPTMTLSTVSNVCGLSMGMDISTSMNNAVFLNCGTSPSPTPTATQSPIPTPTDTPTPTPTDTPLPTPTDTPLPPTPTPAPTYGLLINGQVNDTITLPSTPRPGGGTPVCDTSVLQGMVLTNAGSLSTNWVTNFDPPGQDEIGYSPIMGTLASGASISITLSPDIILVSRPSETIEFLSPGALPAELTIAGFCQYP